MKILPTRGGGRTWEWGPFWFNRNYIQWWLEPTWPRQPRFSRSWIQEVDSPWRAGIGIALKFGNHTYNFGVWRRRVSPHEEYRDLILKMTTEPQGDV